VFKVREEVVNVIMASILEGYGMPNAALVQFNGIPDIYMIIRGLRFIIEAKDVALEHTLEPQIDDRLARNLCEVAVGVVYPTEVVTDHLSMPSTKQVEQRLLRANMKVMAHASSGLYSREIISLSSTTMQQLPELLYSISERAMPETEMVEAVDAIRQSIENFTRNISSIGDAAARAKQIEEILEPK
jgi:hypothetical protein